LGEFYCLFGWLWRFGLLRFSFGKSIILGGFMFAFSDFSGFGSRCRFALGAVPLTRQIELRWIVERPREHELTR
jgi:hypothetical protein